MGELVAVNIYQNLPKLFQKFVKSALQKKLATSPQVASKKLANCFLFFRKSFGPIRKRHSWQNFTYSFIEEEAGSI